MEVRYATTLETKLTIDEITCLICDRMRRRIANVSVCPEREGLVRFERRKYYGGFAIRLQLESTTGGIKVFWHEAERDISVFGRLVLICLMPFPIVWMDISELGREIDNVWSEIEGELKVGRAAA